MNEIEILEEQAINAAVKLQWDNAVEINDKILSVDKNNVTAHLRNGFAFLQLKQMDKAHKHYKQALSLQPGNVIAQDNLEKLAVLQEAGKKGKNSAINLNPNLFLEIPGKTKSIALVNNGQRDTIADLAIGQEVIIKAKKHKIEIRTNSGDYIGTLPDDISRRLLAFLEAESVYQAFIKEASMNRVVVFIKEIKKGKKVSMYLSFPPNPQQNIQSLTNKEESDEEIDENDDKDHIEQMAEALKDSEEEVPYSGDEDEEEVEE